MNKRMMGGRDGRGGRGRGFGRDRGGSEFSKRGTILLKRKIFIPWYTGKYGIGFWNGVVYWEMRILINEEG